MRTTKPQRPVGARALARDIGCAKSVKVDKVGKTGAWSLIGAHPRPYSSQLRPPVKIQSACLVYILKIMGKDFSAAKREKIENFEKSKIPITKKRKFYNIFSAAKMEIMQQMELTQREFEGCYVKTELELIENLAQGQITDEQTALLAVELHKVRQEAESV